MQRKMPMVLAAVLTIACVMLGAQERRSVVLEITLPNGSSPELRILEGETGTVTLPEMGKYGFVLAIVDGTVAVGVYDLNRRPGQLLQQIEATVGGDAVRSTTDPQFQVRVVRVVAQ